MPANSCRKLALAHLIAIIGAIDVTIRLEIVTLIVNASGHGALLVFFALIKRMSFGCTVTLTELGPRPRRRRRASDFGEALIVIFALGIVPVE